MNKRLIAAATIVAGVGVVTPLSLGVAHAATTSTQKTNVGSSGIPRSVFKQARLDAAATVLNTSTSAVQTAHQQKTLGQLVTQAGLTKKTFVQKVRAQLETDLQAKGYSQDQITIALQHRDIVRLHHRAKKT